jgi:hypothetical protein
MDIPGALACITSFGRHPHGLLLAGSPEYLKMDKQESQIIEGEMMKGFDRATKRYGTPIAKKYTAA